jgi:hypothetical protein
LTVGDIPKDQEYPMKLKGMAICFSLLKNALCGNYVNFGVFRLYGDTALHNALSTFIKLLFSVPRNDLLVSFVYKSFFEDLLPLKCFKEILFLFRTIQS